MFTPISQLFIFAGEASGDLHGSHLIRALKNLLPSSHITGVGGPKMRAEGMQSILNMEDFSTMGFSDVALSFPKLYRQFYQVRDYILKTKPSLVIFIDYPGFNLRMAKALRKKGFRGKLVQYICPTVWAWGKNRIDQMSRYLDLLLTIFPFESDCFINTSLPVHYVGNPLVEYMAQHQYEKNWQEKFQMNKEKKLIALFPGSRLAEINHNLPKLLETAERYKQTTDAQFGIAYSQESHQSVIEKRLLQYSLKNNKDIFLIPHRYCYDLMQDCHAAIAKSGTITLELALHAKPTIVVYQLSWLNRAIAKYLIRFTLPYFCIVNILANKEIFPEFIKSPFTAEDLFHSLKKWDETSVERYNCIENCKQIPSILKSHWASQKAAQKIQELLTK